MPLTFYIIITVQAITLILWSIFTKKKITIPELLVSGLVGTLLGIPFDIILGNLQIYTYITQLNTSKVLLTGLSMTQLVVNGFLSYGITVATAKLFTTPSVPVQEKIQKILLVIYSITLITSLLLIQALPNGTISLMFACGICVVIFGELLLMLRKKSGPVSQLLTTRKLQPFLLLIAQCAVIGITCEAVNYFFPFWAWLPGTLHSRFLIESLIVSLGYIAAIHPMIIFWKLIEKKP